MITLGIFRLNFIPTRSVLKETALAASGGTYTILRSLDDRMHKIAYTQKKSIKVHERNQTELIR